MNAEEIKTRLCEIDEDIYAYNYTDPEDRASSVLDLPTRESEIFMRRHGR